MVSQQPAFKGWSQQAQPLPVSPGPQEGKLPSLHRPTSLQPPALASFCSPEKTCPSYAPLSTLGKKPAEFSQGDLLRPQPPGHPSLLHTSQTPSPRQGPGAGSTQPCLHSFEPGPGLSLAWGQVCSLSKQGNRQGLKPCCQALWELQNGGKPQIPVISLSCIPHVL